MSDVDADPKVIELTKQLKAVDDAIAAENSEFARAERTGELEEGAGTSHFNTLEAMEGERDRVARELTRRRKIVEEAHAIAAKVDPTALSEEIRKAQQESELAAVDAANEERATLQAWGGSGTQADIDAHQREHQRREHDRDVAALVAQLLTRRQDELAGQLSPDDTGHYDDGHGFGWTKPKPPDKPENLDTGHYDDGHSFGWGTKKKIAVAGGIVAAILAIVAGAVALTSGGGGGSTAKPAPSAPADSSQSASSSSTVSALPLDTVLAGCIAIDPQGGTTILHPGFLVANPQSGAYTATFANGPTGSVHGNGTANGNLIVTDVTITAFGTYDGLTLTGPGGTPIALGPIASQLPLDINAQTDKPNGCDPHGLEMPAAASPSGDRAQTSIVNFLSQFSSASQKADVAFLAGALDPAVLARYGRDQCTTDLSAVPADPSANLTFKAITSGPEPYTYTSDSQSTVVPDTYTVAVSRTANGTTTDSSLHLSIDPSGSVHWFTDCTH